MTTLVTNNAFSTLAGNISNVSTTFSVQAGEGVRFPAPGSNEQAFISITTAGGVTEIIRYTTRTTDAFSGLTRGADGTTAQSFVAGDLVELRVVAANYTADGILPNQVSANGKFLKSVSLVATWTQIANTDVSGLGTLSTQNGTFSGTSSGTNTGDQTITLTGDVTGSGTGSFAATIGTNKVTLAQMAQVATARLMGRVTAATGNVEVLTAAQAKTVLAYVPGDIPGLALVATSGNAGDLTGTLSTAQLPAMSGDVSNSVGSGVLAIGANKVTLGMMAQIASSTVLGRTTASTGNVEVLSALPAAVLPAYTGDVTKPVGSTVTTIANNVVSLGKMATVAANTFLGRITASTGNVESLTATQAKTVLGITGSDVSGLAPIATSGSATDLTTGTVPAGRMPAHTGDVTSTVNTVALTIGNNVVSLAKMAQIATARFLGRVTASTGNVEELTAAQAKTLLAIASSDVTGLAPIATSGSATDLTTGTVPAGRVPAFTGDVTNTVGTVATTIAANAVTLSKMAQINTSSFLGRTTAGTGNVEILSALQTKVILGLNVTNYSVAVPSGTDAIDFCQITNPNFSANFEVWLTVADSAFALSKRYFSPVSYGATGGAWHKMLPIATTGAYSGNDVEVDISVSGPVAILRIRRTSGSTTGTAKLTVMVGGEIATVVTSSSTTYASATASAIYSPTVLVQRAGFVGVGHDNPIYNLDVLGTFHTSGGVQIDGNINANGTVGGSNLSGTHTGTSSGANSGDQTITLTSDVTGSGTGSFATTIAANAVTLAKMAQVATAVILGRLTGGTGNVETLTAAQAKTLLAIAQADVSGLTTGSTPTFAGVTAGASTFSGNVTVTGDVIPSGYVRGLKAVYFTQYTVGVTTGSVAVDFSYGQKQKLTTTGNVTALTFSFPGAGHYQLVMVTGANTVAFPAVSSTFQWLNATAAPTLNTGTYGGVLNLYNDGTMTLASYSKIGAV